MQDQITLSKLTPEELRRLEASQPAGADTLAPSHAPKPPSKLGAAFDFITNLMEQGNMGSGTAGMATGLRMAKQELTDPENLSSLGGAAGGAATGAASGALFGPVGALVGGTVGAIGGGTLASKYGEGKDWGPALKEGATEGMFQAGGAGLGKAVQLLGKPAMKGGHAVVRHAFGPQAAVAKTFGEDVRGDVLDALTDMKLRETPILAPVGGRTAPHMIQEKIQREGINPRTAILAGAAGDRPTSPRAALNPVVTAKGDTVHPLKDVYDAAFGKTNYRNDVKSIGNTVRGAFAEPTGAGPGHATINNTRMMKYVERTTPGELPPLPPELASSHYTPDAEAALRKALGIDQPTPDTSRWTPQMRESIPARDTQEMVTGNYKVLDDIGAFTNDPSPSASRDALKGMTRGLKEETQRVVPEIIPFNQRMSELIPLREALRQAEAQGHGGSLVRLGETMALGGGRPGMAIGSSLNRPRVESMLGQSSYELGKKMLQPSTRKGVKTLTPQLMRLLQALRSQGER